MMRQRKLQLNDSRCYNGAYIDADMVWSQWEPLDSAKTFEQAIARVNFWKELNDYAVSQRGASATRQFEIDY